MGRPTLSLALDHAERVTRAVRAGHPWIYDRAVAPGGVPRSPGEIVAIAADGARLACGFVDPTAPIRVRVLDRDPEAALDDAWARAAGRAAAERRRSLGALAETDAIRAIHGENDGLAGLTIDVYAGCAVVVFDGGAAAAFWRPRLDAVVAGLIEGGVAITTRWVRGVRGRRGAGEGDGGPIVAIREGAARFAVDVHAGQKTGFFLDQRGNRARVAALAAGGRVLNLCAYTGGFSIACGLAGAAAVTSVDLAPAAIAAADRHWRDNGLVATRHHAVVADCFAFLDEAAATGRRWDVVIADPPSFAASEAARPTALAAYTRLNRAALAVTRPGGLLISASCSSHITEADLRAVVAAAGPERALRIVEARGADPDHPVRAGFPEGRYLKLLIVVA